jgi:uncharacterized repeat protein (TIGR01451 family)/fimbrial isopeptide formation D2 family protein
MDHAPARAALAVLAALLMLASAPTRAAEKFCSEAPYNGVIDGNVLANPPTQISVDTSCTFRNWPQSRPLTTTINFNFQSGDPLSLIVFDNVYYTGNMACSNTDDKFKIWFTNSAIFAGNNSCQDLFIPVEKIDKASPAATATIGIPFTYTLTIPVMFDPATGTVTPFPSANDLGNIHVSDDLTAAATGAEMTLVGINAYYKGSGIPIPVTNLGDSKHLDFTLPDIAKGSQVVVEITVVLDSVAANANGTVFTNVAKWEFSRAVDVNEDGVISPGEFFNPLPGEWGTAQPMTVAEPVLVVAKSSTTTALNLADVATYSVSAQNTGGSDAWNVTLRDILPDGMCVISPLGSLAVRVVAADGVTTVRTLAAGSDYNASFAAAPSCELAVTLTDAGGAIAPTQRLMVTYDSQLDPGFTNDGALLTNVAGATAWSNGPATQASRRSYSRTLTDGTPAVVDHQDNQTVTAGLSGYYFEKTVENLATGAFPATTAAPGDRLRYHLRLFNVDQTINAITVTDVLDVAGSFTAASFGNVTVPAGATWSFNASTGQFTVSGNGAPLNLPVGGEIDIVYEITLRNTLVNGNVVSNQGSLAAASGFAAVSDDPYVNGVASPTVAGDEDPTRVTIITPGPLAKANPAQASVAIGEQFRYRITVPAAPSAEPLYDVRILDDLLAPAADLRFVGASVVSGGSWTLSNTGSATSLVIRDTVTGIDIPAGGQAVIEITVELSNTATNQRGLAFSNSASYTYNRVNGSVASQKTGVGASTGNLTIVEPEVALTKAVAFVSPVGKPATDPATVADVLVYTVTASNSGDATAFDMSVVDTLPAGMTLVPGSATATLNGIAVAGFVATPAELPDGSLAWGAENGDGSLDVPAGQSLVMTYRVTVESVSGAPASNRVVADWSSLQGSVGAERSGVGCPLITQPDDYCAGPAQASVGTVDNTALQKAVPADSWAEAPASITDPAVRVGDTITYTLTLRLQEYTTRNVVVQDLLPAGLALQSFTIAPAAGFAYTLAAQPAAGATGTLRWEFGDISNAPSNDGTPVDSLVIQYVARVLPDAAPVGVDLSLSQFRDNVATLSYTGGDPALYPSRLRASERVEVRQPRMGALTKVDQGSGRTGSGTVASPYQVRLATDVMQFRLQSCNAGQAPAYGVVLSDLLAAQFDETDLAATPPVVRIGATTLAAGTDYSVSLPARGGELRISLGDSAPIAPGACVTVDYAIGFHTDTPASSTWSNQARVDGYFSLPAGQGRTYAAGAAAQVWMTNLAGAAQLLKTLQSASEATIGDELTWQIRVPATPMNIALNNVVVSDTLHAALAYTGATATLGGAPLVLTDSSVAPGQVSLGIASIPAGQQALITLRARVANNASASAGTSIANTAAYTWTGMPPGTVTASTAAPVTLVEPLLSVGKAASTSLPTVGSLFTYTLTLNAAGAGAGDNFSGAFDLTLEDSLGLGLRYEPGTARLNGAVLADPATIGDGSGSPQQLSWSAANGVDLDLAEGATATVTYQVRVLPAVAPGQSLANSVVARWTGRNGSDANERIGSGTPAENDYFTVPVVVTVSTPLAFTFAKAVTNVSTGQTPGDNASPGDILRYTLVVTNDSVVPVTGLQLLDDLDAAFLAGSLQIVSVSDAGANSGNSSASGGVNATGLVDIRNLSLGAAGDVSATRTVVIEARLKAVLPSASTVLNQGRLLQGTQPVASSNTVSTLIASAPQWIVQKISQDLTGDANVLLPGDTLRYTITVRNTGNENATGVTLRDLVPGFTSYRPGTTALNGVGVADPAAGVSALQGGLLLRAATSTGPGMMPADAAAGAGSLATVTFEVTVNAATLAGTLISNQGVVTGAGQGSGAFPEQLSDDPATTVANDPTRDIVGSLPLLDAQKTVTLLADNGLVGEVDGGDVLRYTLTVSNANAIAAIGVQLTDAVPANTSYVADSTTLNGVTVGAPDGGLSPLAAGLAVNSAGAAAGTVAGNASAVVTFDVQVDAGTAAGTVISNQGLLDSVELPVEPTDADGIDSNGDQPTDVVVGTAQQLTLVKEVSVVGGGMALPGGFLDYTVRVTNSGVVPVTALQLRDDLVALAGQASYVAGSARLNGATAGVTVVGDVISADHGASYGALAVGAATTLRFRVQIAAGVTAGTTLTNTGEATWSPSAFSTSASVSIAIGGIPGTVTLNGQAWHDADFDDVAGTGEANLADWSVDLYRGGSLLGSTRTDAGGLYRFSGLAPATVAADQYELRFRAPGATASTALLGLASSAFSNGLQRISAISASGGSSVQGLNLPIDPNGVVYDALLRQPVPGATLVLVAAASGNPVAASCFDDPVQQGQVTTLTGFYKFDLNFSDASCPAGGAYLIRATPPARGYAAGESQLLPPASSLVTAPLDVPSCPGSADDAVPATAGACEAQAAALAPAPGIAGGAGTRYFLHVTLANGVLPGDSQIFNNHIPLDPVLDNTVAISKTSALVNVSRGQLVPYVIRVRNSLPVALTDIRLIDRFPAGFKYVAGSAALDGIKVEPVTIGLELGWPGLVLPANGERVLKLLMVVGAGVGEGDYVNRARVFNAVTGGAASGEARATVRVVPDPTFDCTDVIGKVFDDANLNGLQDGTEAGLPGVRLATARGLLVTSDAHGRFHLTCAVAPDENRGSNFILKLDDRTLPSGYRVTTANPEVLRATRGKMLKFSFGAALHKVVRLDLANGVFEAGTTTLRPQWATRLPLLVSTLQRAPAVLRLAYLAEAEDEALVQRRVKAIRQLLAAEWARAGQPYELAIETEVFWRTGAPPARRIAK